MKKKLDTKNQIEQYRKNLVQFVQLLAERRFILLFVILAGAVGFALIRTSSFIDVPRNEQVFQEEVSKITYKQIDQTILDSFKTAQDDSNVDVSSQFDDGRSNPFVD